MEGGGNGSSKAVAQREFESLEAAIVARELGQGRGDKIEGGLADHCGVPKLGRHMETLKVEQRSSLDGGMEEGPHGRDKHGSKHNRGSLGGIKLEGGQTGAKE